MTTSLAASFDALARVDDGTATGDDHVCAQRLELRLQAAAERVRSIETLRDLDRWQRWHEQHCDDDDTCTHYEPVEG